MALLVLGLTTAALSALLALPAYFIQKLILFAARQPMFNPLDGSSCGAAMHVFHPECCLNGDFSLAQTQPYAFLDCSCMSGDGCGIKAANSPHWSHDGCLRQPIDAPGLSHLPHYKSIMRDCSCSRASIRDECRLLPPTCSQPNLHTRLSALSVYSTPRLLTPLCGLRSDCDAPLTALLRGQASSEPRSVLK